MLIVFAGQPGTGKTTIAQGLAGRVRGTHLPVDGIDEAGYARAEHMLRRGLVVIADGVHPVAVARLAWRQLAQRTHVPIVEIEVVRAGVASRPDYEPWDRPPVVIDTTGRTVDQSVTEAVGALQIY